MRYLSSLSLALIVVLENQTLTMGKSGMSRLIAVLLLAMSILSIACSSGPEPTVESLRQRAEKFDDAISTEDWFALYAYFPPAFHAVCSPGEFVNYTRADWTERKEGLGIGHDGTIIIRHGYVRVEGTDGYATLEIDALNSDGGYVVENLVPDSQDDDPSWTFIDGEWFLSDDDPDEDCG